MKLLSLFALFLTAPAAFAGASEIEFTPEEIAANHIHSQRISDTAASCLTRTWSLHREFYKKRGYSKFYGNRHPQYKTREGRKAALLKILPELAKRVKAGERAAIQELDQRERELETTSCIGLTLSCLGEGFHAAGLSETWKKIYTWLGRTGPDGTPLFYGTDLQKALVDLGWRSLYWNPDLSQNEEWDRLEQAFNPLKEGQKWNPVWGGHAYRWALVKRQQQYYGVPVHDIQTLVNFGVRSPEELKQVPFFVGTAHAGYHVFPGFSNRVIEAHSMRELKSFSNLEVGEFNPLYQPVNGVQDGNGAPRWTRSEHYRSGVIVVPPGMVRDKPFLMPPPAEGVPPNGTIPPEERVEEPRAPRHAPPPPPRRERCFLFFCE